MKRPADEIHPIEFVARVGYGARGVVYILLGAFTAMAALELRSRTVGAEGALRAFVEWPLGTLWLGALAAGLAGFVVWRLLQAVLDADRRGSKPKDLLFRTGQGFSALLYAGLAWSAVQAIDGVGDLREGGGQAPAAALLELPLGETLLLVAAAVTAGAAAGNLFKAASRRFGHELACTQAVRTWAVPVGRAGYAARGLVFGGLALILAEIGLDLVSAQEGTVARTLQEVERLPFGSALLLATGVALAAFGLFGLVEARFRRIEAPEEVGG
ncbi:MAG: DUF1206 domain-containing protein [Proteobacteria bacterium]|nr:DUF1206 domain-containing protein [Pseudomonadota bacterium]